MQRTAIPRRRPLVSLIVGLTGAVTFASLAQSAPIAGDVIGVYPFSSTTSVTDLTGTAAVGGYAGRGELLLANDGNFYVAQTTGGAAGAGAVMRISPDGSGVVMHSFKGDTTEAAVPYAGLIQASDGNLYGTSFGGGKNSIGTVYKIALDGTYSTVFNFTKDSQGPYQPYTGLVQGPDGALYGTTLRGGPANLGTVYRLTLDGTVTTLVSFTGSNGSNPEGRLIVGPDGALYGTTLTGGANDRGTVYKVTPSGTQTILYSFTDIGTINAAGVGTNAIGSNPRAGLALGPDGNFYGTAYQGGPNGWGTIYCITPGGTITMIHAFRGAPTDGQYPLAAVTVMPDGTLYGTTSAGGYSGYGVAWQLTPDGTYSLLHSFTGSLADGSVSYSGLVPVDGFLFGQTFSDTTSSAGVLYKIDLGVGGVLPVSISASPEEITLGASSTLTWSSPTAASCIASGAWTDAIGTSGTITETLTAAGVYTYLLTCTDGAGVARNITASVVVNAPPAQTVDGGATTNGGGATELISLTLLGGVAAAAVRRRLRSGSL
jgi:uncharacterized repeat protein (TIGR03803 family)